MEGNKGGNYSHTLWAGKQSDVGILIDTKEMKNTVATLTG